MILTGEAIQVISTICVNLLTMSLGMSTGWVSNAMKFLQSKESDLITGAITPAEVDIINSTYCIGALIGALVYGYTADKIGRLWALRTIAILQIIGFILVAYAHNSRTILISRLFIGFACGGCCICIPLFVTEITETTLRGHCGSFLILATGIGLLIAYIVGALVSYNKCVKYYLWLPVIFLVCSFFLHDTPFNLMMHEKLKKAEESILFYRGLQKLAGNVKVEFKALKIFVKSTKESSSEVSWKDFLVKPARKSAIIGVFLVWLEQFSGCFALLFYTASVFQQSGATIIKPEVATILIGFVQLAGSFYSTLVIDKTKRKTLLYISTTGIAIGMTIFGFASQMIHLGFNWWIVKLIPVLALSVSIFAANVGIFSLTFLLISEVTEEKLNRKIVTICVSTSWICAFAVFFLFSPLIYFFGIGGLMYFFALNSIIGGVCIYFMVPETQGRTFDEILVLLTGGKLTETEAPE